MFTSSFIPPKAETLKMAIEKKSMNSRLCRPPRSPLRIDRNNFQGNEKRSNPDGSLEKVSSFNSYRTNTSSWKKGSASVKRMKHSNFDNEISNSTTNFSNDDQTNSKGDTALKSNGRARRSLEFNATDYSLKKDGNRVTRSMNYRLLRPVKPPHSIESVEVEEMMMSMSLCREEAKMDECSTIHVSIQNSIRGNTTGNVSPTTSKGDFSIMAPKKSSVYKWKKISASKQALSPGSSRDICSCLRDLKRVLCGVCGYLMSGGRIRQKCNEHPRHRYLLDLTECPECKSPNALKEHDFPAGTYPENSINKRIDETADSF